MALRTAMLWVHVLAGALWIGACVALVLRRRGRSGFV
jgi:hypothetical protein